MKLLLENWREYLREGSQTGRKLERMAKSIAYSISKSLRDDEVRQAFVSKGALEFKVIWDKPEELKWVRNVTVEMRKDDDFNSSAEYSYLEPRHFIFDDKDRKLSDIILYLQMPVDYTVEEVDKFEARYTSDIRHELEHSGQPTDSVTKMGLDSAGLDWSKLSSIRKYYTDEAETKAHVAGYVLKAKMLGKEASDVIDDEMEDIFNTATLPEYGHDRSKVRKLINKIRGIYLFYLKQRWAEQDWEKEERDNH